MDGSLTTIPRLLRTPECSRCRDRMAKSLEKKTEQGPQVHDYLYCATLMLFLDNSFARYIAASAFLIRPSGRKRVHSGNFATPKLTVRRMLRILGDKLVVFHFLPDSLGDDHGSAQGRLRQDQ